LVRTQNGIHGNPNDHLFVARCAGKTSTTHVVTVTSPTGNRSAAVMGFAGGHTTDVIDNSNGNANTFSTSIAVGSVTPSGNGYLLVAVRNFPDYSGSTGGYVDGTGSLSARSGMSYLIQGTAAASNPTISSSVQWNYGTVIHASFIPAPSDLHPPLADQSDTTGIRNSGAGNNPAQIGFGNIDVGTAPRLRLRYRKTP
jgi:hypothetical protein